MMHTLIDAIDLGAATRPAAVAFRFGREDLTYGELSRRSNQLARWLRNRGVSRGDLVAIHLRKSIEMPVALFGIMKAGAAYVPLDPAAPAERLRQVIAGCDIRAMISHPPLQAKAAELIAAPTPVSIVLGDQANGWVQIAREDDGDLPEARPEADDLAYVIFTSGSTGTPKGIQHSHASGLSYARMAAELYGVTPEDRLANHSPLHFDMSTFEFLSAPLAGATTVIIPEPYLKLPASLSQLVQDEKITIWYSTPFAIIQMAQRGALEDRDLSSLRWVIFGGEPVSRKNLAAFARHTPGAAFSNSYGPAEVNQCTYFHLSRAELDEAREIPIGHVCDNADVRLLDPDTALPADPGELVVRTRSMMRGYKGRPDLNQSAFLQEPDQTIWYRTGDLMRRDEAGLLHYLGRKDRQVKLRGFRVELEEVEACLSACDGIREAAAVLTRAETDTLVGFVSVDDPGTATPSDVRRQVAQRLPFYAVPSEIHVVETFPRTTSGKIDRRALASGLEGCDHD